MSFWISKLLRARFPKGLTKIRFTTDPSQQGLKAIKSVECYLPNGSLLSGKCYDDLFVDSLKVRIGVDYENGLVKCVEYQTADDGYVLDARSLPLSSKVFAANGIPVVGMTRSDSLCLLIKMSHPKDRLGRVSPR